MAAPTNKPSRISRREYLVWSGMKGNVRCELVAGRPSPLPQSYAHAVMKAALYNTFQDALGAAGSACKVVVAGLGVEVGEDSMFIPDALIDCGDLKADDITAASPIVVTETVGHCGESGRRRFREPGVSGSLGARAHHNRRNADRSPLGSAR